MTRTSSYHHPRIAVHRNAAIFELVRVLDHILLPWKFLDDISNGSSVIALTNRHTQTPTDRHRWQQYHLRYAVAAHVVQLPFTPNWGSLQRSSRLPVWRGGYSLSPSLPRILSSIRPFKSSVLRASLQLLQRQRLVDYCISSLKLSFLHFTATLIRLTSPISDNWRLSKIDQKRERLRIIQPATLQPVSQETESYDILTQLDQKFFNWTKISEIIRVNMSSI